MSDQRLLIDNDAFIIFAGTDLLVDTLDVLGYTPPQALRLHALPHMLGKSKGIKARYPADVIIKARAACDQIAALQEREADPTILDRLISAHDDINEGEALLLAIGVERQTHKVLTGDKRALTAFGRSEQLPDLRETLAGRVVCIEIALRLLVERFGARELSNRLASVIPAQQSLKIFFSPANQADHDQCIIAINSYFIDLRTAVGVSLLLNPFDDLRVVITESQD